ncbi:MAG: hypothetical protein Q3999_08565 [Buchananella hordeovulneris]|nr:hypothetical protein [Buchananella hordeovulneris]
MIAYRMQDASRNINDLLDPEQQYSFPMSGDDEDIRRGVSGCESLAELAAYLTTHCIEATTPVLVRIEGPASDDEPLDAEVGEVLVMPTAAELIEDDEEFFNLVGDLVDAYWESGCTLEHGELVEMAEARI